MNSATVHDFFEVASFRPSYFLLNSNFFKQKRKKWLKLKTIGEFQIDQWFLYVSDCIAGTLHRNFW